MILTTMNDRATTEDVALEILVHVTAGRVHIQRSQDLCREMPGGVTALTSSADYVICALEHSHRPRGSGSDLSIQPRIAIRSPSAHRCNPENISQ